MTSTARPATAPKHAFVCRSPDGHLYLNEEGVDEPLLRLPDVLLNLAGFGASPPEYPGLVLVPASDLDALRDWIGGSR